MSHILERIFGRRRLRDVILAGNLEAGPACGAQDVNEARGLRERVLERTGAPAGRTGPDEARMDALCDHLLVRQRDTRRLVATCRLLRPRQARRAGGWAMERAFDLDRIDDRHDALVDIDQLCVDPDCRSGPVLMVLWSALARHLEGGRVTHAIGRVAVPIDDGGHYAASIYRTLARRHLSARTLRVSPRNRLPMEALLANCDPVLPALLEGWLRAGAVVLGEPHFDAARSRADLPMLLEFDRSAGRFVKRTAPALAPGPN